MMRDFFNSENPLMQALSRMVDLVILNLMALISSLPVITFGTSMTAMNYVLIHYVRGDGTYTADMFIRSFKRNIRQGIQLGLVYIAAAVIAAADLIILRGYDRRSTTVMMIIISIFTAYVYVLAVYSFALLARFENSVRGTLANALKISLGHMKATIGIAAIWLGWMLCLVYLNKAAFLAVILYGFSLPAYLSALIYYPIFRDMESARRRAADGAAEE